jgi:hypothetical protein
VQARSIALWILIAGLGCASGDPTPTPSPSGPAGRGGGRRGGAACEEGQRSCSGNDVVICRGGRRVVEQTCPAGDSQRCVAFTAADGTASAACDAGD